jgi:hypothetical protein
MSVILFSFRLTFVFFFKKKKNVKEKAKKKKLLFLKAPSQDKCDCIKQLSAVA